MTVIIIPHGRKEYTKIIGIGNLEVAGVTKQVLRDIWNIAGNPETYFLEGIDDWDGSLRKLRRMARKQERGNKGTLMNKLINYIKRR